MTRFNVHIFREMRLHFPGIEASTADEAAQIAAGKPTDEAEYTEDCDGESLEALVDVVGNDDFSQSVMIDLQEAPDAVQDDDVDVHKLLGQRRQVAVIWSIEDVQCVRPDLTDDQAWQVLQRCDRFHDCEVGINWLFIKTVADDLFPAPEQGGGQ